MAASRAALPTLRRGTAKQSLPAKAIKEGESVRGGSRCPGSIQHVPIEAGAAKKSKNKSLKFLFIVGCFLDAAAGCFLTFRLCKVARVDSDNRRPERL